MYAVTAATGQLGRLVIEHLKQLVDPIQIVAVVRDTGRAADLGVQVRQANYSDEQALRAALSGVERVLLISGSPDQDRVRQHRNVVEAAKANDVRHLVYTSVLHANRWPVSIMSDHVQTEEIIRKSSIGHTILRNGWYTENNTSALDSAIQQGKILGAAAAGRIAWAARRDYAEAAAKVLASGKPSGRTYELGGDRSLNMNDLAAEVGRQSGKPISYVNMAREDYVTVLTGFGLPAPAAETFATLDADAISKDVLATESKKLSSLLGRSTTPIAETIRSTLTP